MLQQIRKFATSRIVAVAFFGPLIASFAIWGIADIFRGTSDTNVFTLGSVHVPVDQFARDYQNALRNAGAVLPPEQQKAVGQQVLDRMTLATALDYLTDSLGLTATDGRVRAQIQQIGAFSGPLGTFDHDKFLSVIRQAGYGEDEFVAVSRKDAARSQLLRAVEGGYQLPPDYGRALLSYLFETREAQYVQLTPAAAGEIAAPNDTVLEGYVRTHPELFSTPEYRSVSFASVAVDDIASTLTVTDKQIQDEIDSNPGAYSTPETRELEQIPFKTEADARAAKAAVASGKSFDALALEQKLKPADYKLGELTKPDLAIDPARATAAFALAEGGVSDPIKGTFGWVLMRATKITPGTSKTHDEIRLELQRKLAQAKMTDMSNAFIDAVAGGAGIDEAAHKAGMKFTHVAAVDARGLAPDGTKVASADNPDLLGEIFKAEIGEDGDPFSTADGSHSYAIKVDGVTPPKVKPLSAVHDDAVARWTTEQRRIQLGAKVAALVAKGNSDGSLAAVAASAGAPVLSSPALTRRTDDTLFSKPLVRALFAAPPGGVIAYPLPDGGYIIARVSGVAHPPQLALDLQSAQIVGQLSQEVSGDFTITLAKAVQADQHLTINQKLVDTTVGGNSGSGS